MLKGGIVGTALVVLAVAGCGGGDSSPKPVAKTTPEEIKPQLNPQVVAGLASALPNIRRSCAVTKAEPGVASNSGAIRSVDELISAYRTDSTKRIRLEPGAKPTTTRNLMFQANALFVRDGCDRELAGKLARVLEAGGDTP